MRRQLRVSIRTAMIIVFSLLMSVLIAALGVTVSVTMENSIERTSVSYGKQLVNQAKYNLDTYLTGINSALLNFTKNPVLVEMFKYYDGDNAYDNLANRKTLNRALASMMDTHSDIANMAVLDDRVNIMPMLGATYVRLTDPFVLELIENYPGEEYAVPIYHSLDYPTYYDPQPVKKEIPVSLVIRDYSVYDRTNYGFVLASLRTVKLDNLFSSLKESDGFASFILDEAGRVVYGSEVDWVDRTYDEYLAKAGVAADRDDFLLDSHGNAILMACSAKLSLNGWELVIVSDMSETTRQVNAMRTTVMVATLLTILLVVAASALVSTKITAPLKMLAGQMENMDYNALRQKLDDRFFYKEIERLYGGYNDMTDRIEGLIAEVYDEQLRQKDAKYEALQSKINPHFLYNTLQSIWSLAVLERNEDVVRAITALGEMLAYLTYENSDEVTLEKEMDYIRNYVDIQLYRMNDKFTVDYRLSEAAESCVVSKLLVQPVVENAILHGFGDMEEGGVLTIEAEAAGGDLVIRVRDNGKGMDETALDALRQGLYHSKKDSQHKSIGLSNIQERIRLKYGPGYGLEIESTPGMGTTIVLTVPARGDYPGKIPTEETNGEV